MATICATNSPSMSDLLHRDKARCGLEAVAALLLLVALCSIYCYILPKPIQGIPYNSEAVRSPLGDVPAVINDKKGVVDWLLDQAHRHNRPICQVFLRPFGRPFVLISDFREAHDIMLRRKEWDRSDFTIELLGGHAPYHHINQKTNQVWKTQRRLLQDLMMPKFLNNVAAPNIYASTLDLVKLWDAKERLAAGRPFSAEKDVFNASLDAVLEFSFGDSFPHRAIPPQARYAQALTSSDVKLGVAGEVEFADQPVHATIEATLHASVAMGELMDAPFPRLSWWIRSKLPTESRQIRLRHGYIKEQVLESMRRMRAETDPSSDAWVRSAVDMMMRRARLVAEKEGRQPVYWSPAIRDEVSWRPFCTRIPLTSARCLDSSSLVTILRAQQPFGG